MPGFIDGHTHLDMPFGGTVTADDWDTGTAAAVAGGTTTIVDFSLQDVEGTLAGAVETWQGKASTARIDFGLHVAITNLTEAVKQELPQLPALGVATVKIFMAYKGTPLYTADEDLFEALQIARECGLLVLVHAENGDAIAKLQAQALARGDTEPRWHALTRPEAVEAEATNRAIRLAEVADAPLLVVHVSCAGSARGGQARARPRAAGLRRDVPAVPRVRARPTSRAPASRARSSCSRRRCATPSNQPLLWQGLQSQDLHIFGSDHCSFNFAGQKELGRDDFTLIPNGAPGIEERPAVLWTHGVREGRITENLMVAVLATNQAKVHGMAGRKGALAPGADADIVVWDPDLTITVTAANRHGNVDYTPYEGMTFTGAPASVYVRGNARLPRRRGGRGGRLGRFVHRTFAPAGARPRRSADGRRRRGPRGRRPARARSPDRETRTAPSASPGRTRGSPRASGCAAELDGHRGRLGRDATRPATRGRRRPATPTAS